MARFPIHPLLVWTLPTVAVLLSYFWYKKRKIGAPSDTGGSKPIEEEIDYNNIDINKEEKKNFEEKISEPIKIPSSSSGNKDSISKQNSCVTPVKQFNRSLSGVETTPIDIKYPKELNKSSPVIISDEDLDIEIEKVKSMRNGYISPGTFCNNNLAKTLSPCKIIQTAPIEEISDIQPEEEEEEEEPEKIVFTESKIIVSSVKNTPIKKEIFEPFVEKSPRLVPSSNKKGKNKISQREKKLERKMMMAQKDGSTTVKVEDRKEDNTKIIKCNTKLQRNNSGRDSANHSPADNMMGSFSFSSISDNHSEGSSDSGKGCSDSATPPNSRTPQLSTVISDQPLCFEFLLPQGLVGRLIGRQGCFVQSIKIKCNALVTVKKHPTDTEMKICSIEGTKPQVDIALKMIRDKFPLKKYPEVTLEHVEIIIPVATFPLITDSLYLKLIEGINNDTILSCLVTPAHLFLQQPTHPSFPSLTTLNNYMNLCYRAAESPMLPHPIPENTICAALSVDGWYRAMVLSTDEETEVSYVKFVDFGGYAYVNNFDLRQIRHDFMLLPFQAAECFLGNIVPKSDDGLWNEAAYRLVAQLTKGCIIYTQVADYSIQGIPIVQCFIVSGPREIIHLNKRLVDEGFAVWIENEEEIPEVDVEIACRNQTSLPLASSSSSTSEEKDAAAAAAVV